MPPLTVDARWPFGPRFHDHFKSWSRARSQTAIYMRAMRPTPKHALPDGRGPYSTRRYYNARSTVHGLFVMPIDGTRRRPCLLGSVSDVPGWDHPLSPLSERAFVVFIACHRARAPIESDDTRHCHRFVSLCVPFSTLRLSHSTL